MLLDERVFPALGILKIGAVLEQAGYSVDHLDLCGVKNFEDVVRDYNGADIFCITATTPQIPAAIRISEILRERPATNRSGRACRGTPIFPCHGGCLPNRTS